MNSAPVIQVSLIQAAWLCGQQGHGVTKPQGSAVQVTQVFPRLEGKVAPSSPSNVTDSHAAARHWLCKTEAEGLTWPAFGSEQGLLLKKTTNVLAYVRRQTWVTQW